MKEKRTVIFILIETCNFNTFSSRKVFFQKRLKAQVLLLTNNFLIQNDISVLSEFMFLFMTYPFSICQFTKL